MNGAMVVARATKFETSYTTSVCMNMVALLRVLQIQVYGIINWTYERQRIEDVGCEMSFRRFEIY